MSLNHQFVLIPKADYSDRWLDWSFMNHEPVERVSIHDDIIQYINDSLKWIPTVNPCVSKSRYGLNIHGITLVNDEGAALLRNIFDSWSSLFSNGPEILILTGSYRITNGKGMYQKIEIKKKEITQSFNKICDFSIKVIENDSYILHYGI